MTKRLELRLEYSDSADLSGSQLRTVEIERLLNHDIQEYGKGQLYSNLESPGLEI